MKKLIFKGFEFQYEIEYYNDEFGESYTTKFYLGSEIICYKKYWLWGPIITKEVPKLVFSIPRNIESVYYTKDEVREMISREVKLLYRSLEIANGEII